MKRKIVIAWSLVLALISSILSPAGVVKGAQNFDAPGRFLKEEGTEITDTEETEDGVLYQGISYTVTLAEGVLRVSGTGAMEDYSKLEDIPWYAAATEATSIVVEEGITEIGKLNFYDFTKVTSVSLPSTLSRIGVAALAGLGKVTQITIPEGVTKMEDYSLERMGISVLHIPASVEEYSTLSVCLCSSLEEYTVEEGNTVLSAENGILYSKDKKKIVAYPIGKTDTSFVIPQGVEVLGSSSFSGAKYLQQVTIASTVTKLEDWVFSMSGLTSAVVPSTVTEVGNGPFDGCPDLRTLEYNPNTKTAPYRLCYICPSLEKVVLGDSIEAIANQAFYQCERLTDVTLPKNLVECGSGGGVFYECNSLEYITLPDTVELIGLSCFYNCESLKYVNLPTSLKTIGAYAFYQCDAMTGSWMIPSTIENIYQHAFDECTLQVQLPDGMTQMEDGSFCFVIDLKTTGELNYEYAYEVLNLVNAQRSAVGLAPLTMDADLMDTAMQRAAECVLSFSHTRPNGMDCFAACDKMSGENIAVGNNTPESVVKSWMGSAGHKANIMSGYYSSIGVGCFKQNGILYWVQCFGGTDIKEAAKPANVTKQMNIQSVTGGLKFVASQSLMVLNIEEKKSLQVKASLPDAWRTMILDSECCTWESSDSKVVSCKNGEVTGVSAGKATVTAAIGTAKVMFQITVNSKKNLDADAEEEEEEASVSEEAWNVKVSKLKVKAGKKKITLSWKRVAGAKGYQIQIAQNAKFSPNKSDIWKVKSLKKNIKKLNGKKLKSKKNYFVRIRPYKKNGVYGQWVIKKVKIR